MFYKTPHGLIQDNRIQHHKNHTVWFLLNLITLVIISITAITYDIFLIKSDKIVLLILKIIPMFCLISTGISYFFLYSCHRYAVLITISFIFCLFGDILLAISNNYYFLIIGGINFIIARIFMITALSTFPYGSVCNRSKKFNTSRRVKIISGSINALILLFIIGYYEVRVTYIQLILIVSYMLIVTLQNYISIIRIQAYNESLFPVIIAMIGTILFGISDILLFHSSFVKSNIIIEIISIDFYWLGSYMIAISMVRNTKSFHFEKDGMFEN